MAPNVITDFEYVFSKTVIDTCFHLQPCHAVEFRSSNNQKGTQSRLKLFKQVDDSVRFHLYVCHLNEEVENTNSPADILIQNDSMQTQDSITVECENYVLENEVGTISNSPNKSISRSDTSFIPISSNNWSASDNKSNTIALKQLHELEMQKKKKRLFMAEDVEMEISGTSTTEAEQAASELNKKEVIIVNVQSDNTLKKVVQPFQEIPSKSKMLKMSSPENCNESKESVKGLTYQGQLKDANEENKVKQSQVEITEMTSEENSKKAPVTKTSSKSSNIRSGRHTKRPVRFTQSMANESEIKDSLAVEKIQKHGEMPQLSIEDGSLQESGLDEGENIECQLCDTVVKNRTNYYIHLSAKHSRNKKFNQLVEGLFELGISCGVCAKEFTSRKDFKEHTQESHGRNSTKGLKCEFCNKQFKDVQQKNEHVKKEHIRDGKECLECGTKTKGVSQLKSHLKRIHPASQNTYLCHLCPASFKVVNYLNIHISQVHTENAKDTFKCSQCPRSFATDKYLKNHIFRVHRERKFSCSQSNCDRTFKTQANLKRHVMLVHEANKLGRKFKCQQCGKAFKLKANMKEHILLTHLKKFNHECNICHLTFRRKKELETHHNTLHSTSSYLAKPSFPNTSLTVMVPGNSATTGTDDKGVATFIVATPEILNTFGVSSVN